ncbi:hypothetical protein [Streptomyces virginiae]|uniref:hypothetical protein n=1 Tax=Streptomyces virginiae TaxID=1961 RepID=UPI003650ADBB
MSLVDARPWKRHLRRRSERELADHQDPGLRLKTDFREALCLAGRRLRFVPHPNSYLHLQVGLQAEEIEVVAVAADNVAFRGGYGRAVGAVGVRVVDLDQSVGRAGEGRALGE